MFCARCGKEIDDDSTFCPFCGQKIDAPVENKKSFQPSVLGNTKTVKLVGGITAGLVMLSGVVFGISKLAGGSEVKETSNVAEESEESQETFDITKQSEELQEMTDTVEQSEEVVTDSASSDEDNMYSITFLELNSMLEDFFKLHLGCYIDYYCGKCKTEPVNISTMLEHTGITGFFTLEDGMRVVADYDDAVFNMKMVNSYLYDAVMNGGNFRYRCSVEIKEANIPSNFKYYKGTDSTIGIAAKLNYYIEDTRIKFYNDYVVVLMSNSADNPKEWLLKSAFFITESDYNEMAGDIFKKTLINEDQEVQEFANDNWKQIYLGLDELKEMQSGGRYCLQDINNDGIPELYTDWDATDTQKLYYIAKDGSVNTIDYVYAYSEDIIRCSYGRMDNYGDQIYQYDSNTGMYNLVLEGEWSVDWNTNPETYNCLIDGSSCSESEYNERFDAYLSLDDGNRWTDASIYYFYDTPLETTINKL